MLKREKENNVLLGTKLQVFYLSITVNGNALLFQSAISFIIPHSTQQCTHLSLFILASH